MLPAIRRFRADDVGFALEQTAREGWDPTAELFQAALAHDPAGCYVGEIDGRPCGLVTTTCYARSGWVGNLIVVPQQRRRGIGRMLMNRALEHLDRQGLRTVRLEADAPGIPLYRSLGFVAECESLRFRAAARQRALPAPAAEPMTAADLPRVRDFDLASFGDERGRLLELLLQGARAAYWVWRGSSLRGYCFVVPSRFGIRIGPCVAADVAAARALVQTALTDWPNQTALVGVPAANRAAAELYFSLGFEPAPGCLRMRLGPDTAGGRPENIFAIANGAMG